MSNDDKMLQFPIQINDDIDFIPPDDDLVAEMRVRIARRLNQVKQGERPLDDRLKSWILRVNNILSRNGYSPVPVDFE